MKVRAARSEDVEPMLRLMAPHVATETLLPRDETDVLRRLGEFLLVETDAEEPKASGRHDDGRLVALAALHHYGGGLAEVRTLAVAESHKGNGVGRILVGSIIEKARAENLSRLIALTRTPEFFEKIGFSRATIEGLPEKVQKDCVFCPRRDRCDEVAVVLDLS